jgi:hypothetical protein
MYLLSNVKLRKAFLKTEILLQKFGRNVMDYVPFCVGNSMIISFQA